jgi:hypothetical protein
VEFVKTQGKRLHLVELLLLHNRTRIANSRQRGENNAEFGIFLQRQCNISPNLQQRVPNLNEISKDFSLKPFIPFPFAICFKFKDGCLRFGKGVAMK